MVLALGVGMNRDVAARAASWTNRIRLVQIPNPRLETKILFGQRADRTDVHSIDGVVIIESRAGIWEQLRVITAIEDAKLVRFADFIAEANATRTENTTLGIKHDVTTNVERFVFLIFILDHLAVVEAVLHVILL